MVKTWDMGSFFPYENEFTFDGLMAIPQYGTTTHVPTISDIDTNGR